MKDEISRDETCNELDRSRWAGEEAERKHSEESSYGVQLE